MKRKTILIFWIIMFSMQLFAQPRTIRGTVTDEAGEPVIGVNIFVVGTTRGTISDISGNYSLTANPEDMIRFSAIGFMDQTITVGTQDVINIVLQISTEEIEEVIVVGYGRQRKESIVGAIVQTRGEDLKRSTVGSDLINSMSGLLPGVTTIQRTGQPGATDTEILIRGKSTWNNSSPLILVDGVERSMNDIDVNEVQSISVLKDASATAVFGVKGANGVIMITTKRGSEGKPRLSFEANQSMRTVSRIPERLPSYEAIQIRNYAIINELPFDQQSWNLIVPEPVLQYYKTGEHPYFYANTNWADMMLNDWAYSNQFNMNVTGGTQNVKYFGSLAYLREGDMLATQDFGQGYDPDFQFDRYNFRSNLDFQITPTTEFSFNLSGYYGIQQRSGGGFGFGLYERAPDIPIPRYPDGVFGNAGGLVDANNPLSQLNFSGINRTNRSEVITDFILDQKLDQITEGLSVGGRFSFDNFFISSGPNISDDGTLEKYVSPAILDDDQVFTYADSAKYVTYYYPAQHINRRHGYNYIDRPFTQSPENITGNNLSGLQRALFYQVSLNYLRNFGDHEVGGLALFNRREAARGSVFPSYREDWVGRATYNFDQRYFFEFNAAYNGSERFSGEYRFGFFPSYAVGWVVSNEDIVKTTLPFMNLLKFRYSMGKVGNDDVPGRWLYLSTWNVSEKRIWLGAPNVSRGQYISFEGVAGNPDIHWETSTKQNFGIETGFFTNMLSVNLDIFREHRADMLISGEQRKVPDFYGTEPVTGNLGEVKTRGWELEVRLSKRYGSGLYLWGNYLHTYVNDEVIFKEDPELAPAYQKAQGYPVGQMALQMNANIIQTWDEVYTGVVLEDNTKLVPGTFRHVDFNADGVINNLDNAPTGYPVHPQYTYGFTFGSEYKGFAVMAHFFGVYNTNRLINLRELDRFTPGLYYYQTDRMWSPEYGRTNDATYRHISINSQNKGNFNLVDASYLRLKNAMIGYTFSGERIQRLGVSSMRVFANGTNLLYWSKLPDDNEGTQFQHNYASYPLARRINFGVNLTF